VTHSPAQRLALLASALVLVTGCGTPDKPLDLGFKEVPSDVLLGAQTSPTPLAPVGPVSAIPLPPPPSVVSLPPPPFQVPAQTGRDPVPPPVLPSAPSCPADDPLAAPKLEAPTSIGKPPVAGAYLFDNLGTFTVSGANARSGVFPPRTLRVVGNVSGQPGAFTYDVAERVGDTTITTTYGVKSQASLPGEEPGIFILRMTYQRADGRTGDFTPTPPLKLAALPLVRGAMTEQRGVDAQTQTVMTFRSTVEGKARVFACGEPLDTWTVHLQEGTLLSPTQDLEFDSTYQLGTQFGGIVLRDLVAFRGQDGDSGVQRSNRATIANVPKLP